MHLLVNCRFYINQILLYLLHFVGKLEAFAQLKEMELMNLRKTAEKFSFGFKVSKIYEIYYIDLFLLLTMDTGDPRIS